MENRQKNDPTAKKALQKKRLTVLFIILAAFVVLALLNTLEFKAPTLPEDTTPYTPPEQPIQNFYETDEKILSDKTYLSKNRKVYLSRGGETIILDEKTTDPCGKLLYAYLSALKAGDVKLLNSLHNENFFKHHDRFTALSHQALYDIEIKTLVETFEYTDPVTEEDKQYVGCHLTVFEVRYKIYKNDGSFRRDIVDDEMIPQIFTLLTKKNGLTEINSIAYYAPGTPEEPPKASLLPLIMPLVFSALALVLLVLWLILKKAPLLFLTLASFVSFLVSVKFSLLWQILAFLLVFSALFGYFLYKKKKTPPEASDE